MHIEPTTLIRKINRSTHAYFLINYILIMSSLLLMIFLENKTANIIDFM
jgi:hypothetical protein